MSLVCFAIEVFVLMLQSIVEICLLQEMTYLNSDPQWSSQFNLILKSYQAMAYSKASHERAVPQPFYPCGLQVISAKFV
jgi:hypothetical protein